LLARALAAASVAACGAGIAAIRHFIESSSARHARGRALARRTPLTCHALVISALCAIADDPRQSARRSTGGK
jgi:hypothetical protein